MNWRIRCGLSVSFRLLLAGAISMPTALALAPVPANAAISNLNVFVGYADDVRSSPSFPVPWQGAPNTVFIGSGSPLDAGAMRLDNTGSTDIAIDSVVVDLNRPGPTINLWGAFTIPAGQEAILTQTAQFNFDTSDFPIESCGVNAPAAVHPPLVTVTIGGTATTFTDSGHVLDTFGYDLACLGNESLAWVAIGKASVGPPTLTLSPASSTVTIGSPVTVTATLLDPSGSPQPNVTVNFSVLTGPNAGTTGSGVTDANGKATLMYTGTVAGTDTVQASITTATGGTISSNTVTVQWIPADTTSVTVNNGSGDFHDATTVSATLTDTTKSAPISGEPLTFMLNGTETCSGVTNATGTASCALTPGEAMGTYALTASFAGDAAAHLLPSSGSGNFTVTREEDTLTYTGDVNIQNGGAANLAAVLQEDGATPIAGRSVMLTLGSGTSAQTCSAITDASGTAQCTVAPVSQTLGPISISAQFAGDSFYLPATATATGLIFASLASGSFVIGNQNAAVGNSVTYWSAQWAMANSLSGGTAPASFKGFAETRPSAFPGCGLRWSTETGNSSDPPSSVPSFIAVIVSSSISQSGSVVSGDTVRVVIVKTHPGYGPAPGMVGTGTVVAMLAC